MDKKQESTTAKLLQARLGELTDDADAPKRQVGIHTPAVMDALLMYAQAASEDTTKKIIETLKERKLEYNKHTQYGYVQTIYLLQAHLSARAMQPAAPPKMVGAAEPGEGRREGEAKERWLTTLRSEAQAGLRRFRTYPGRRAELLVKRGMTFCDGLPVIAGFLHYWREYEVEDDISTVHLQQVPLVNECPVNMEDTNAYERLLSRSSLIWGTYDLGSEAPAVAAQVFPVPDDGPLVVRVAHHNTNFGRDDLRRGQFWMIEGGVAEELSAEDYLREARLILPAEKTKNLAVKIGVK